MSAASHVSDAILELPTVPVPQLIPREAELPVNPQYSKKEMAQFKILSFGVVCYTEINVYHVPGTIICPSDLLG